SGLERASASGLERAGPDAVRPPGPPLEQDAVLPPGPPRELDVVHPPGPPLEQDDVVQPPRPPLEQDAVRPPGPPLELNAVRPPGPPLGQELTELVVPETGRAGRIDSPGGWRGLSQPGFGDGVCGETRPEEECHNVPMSEADTRIHMRVREAGRQTNQNEFRVFNLEHTLDNETMSQPDKMD
uniref:Uncharacterized protein n=1 Tax=Nothobranchius furzeri TaxID=105023 RepID=A0A8C6KQF5_NOTFU